MRLTMIARSRNADQRLIEDAGTAFFRFSFTFSIANGAGDAIV